jgi:hypothetical protein
MLKDAGHAASMFAKQLDLEADIVIWFRANLPVAGYGPPPAIRWAEGSDFFVSVVTFVGDFDS